MRNVVSIIPDEPLSRWRISFQEAAGALGWLLSRAGLLAVGGTLVWLGSVYGTSLGIDIGFGQGCRAAIGQPDDICTIAEQAGKRLQRLQLTLPLGSAIPQPQKDEIAQVCRQLRAAVPDRLASHYGCEG